VHRRAFLASCATVLACDAPPSLAPGTCGLTVELPRSTRDREWNIWISTGESYRGWNCWHQRTTDGKGYFGDLPPDGYRISASDSSGRGAFYERFGGHDWILLRANQRETVDLDVVEGYRVTGCVLEEDNKTPVEGAYVRVSRPASERWPVQLPSFWTVTDEAGLFTLGGLRDPQKISIQKLGFQDASLGVTGESTKNDVVLRKG